MRAVSCDAPHEITSWLHLSLIRSGHCLRSFQRLFSVAPASVIRSQWHLVLGRRASVCNVSFVVKASVYFHACILDVQNIYRTLPPRARTCVGMFWTNRIDGIIKLSLLGSYICVSPAAI